MNTRNLSAALRSPLDVEPRQRTPQCPDPEWLSELLDQGEEHPHVAELIDHLETCELCTELYSDLVELRLLEAEWKAQRKSKLAQWLYDLKTRRFVPPIPVIREALERLRPAVLEAARRGDAPVLMSPIGVCVRTVQPKLEWEAVLGATGYTVEIFASTDPEQSIYDDETGEETFYVVPLKAGLTAGEIYHWSVTPLYSYVPPAEKARFLVLPADLQHEIESLEQAAESLEERIALLEACGVYDDAQQLLEQKAGSEAEQSALKNARAGKSPV